MTNKYSDAMQRLIINAQARAIDGGETQLTPAHLLLAITDDGSCTAAHALNALGVRADVLQTEILRRIPPCIPDDNPEFHMSDAGRQVVNDALYISRTMGDGKILTIHVLMGIYSYVTPVSTSNALVPAHNARPASPSEILASLGVTREKLWHLASDFHRGYGPLHGVGFE